MREIIVEKISTPESSLIEYLIYHHDSSLLKVKYKRGKYKGMERDYTKFPFEAFEMVLSSQSKGRELLRQLHAYKQEENTFFNFFKNIFSRNNNEPY